MNFTALLKMFGVVAALAGAGYKYAPHFWEKSADGKSVASADGKAAIPAKPGELGEVVLTNHFETVVRVGNGKSCTLVPRQMGSHNVELTLSLESRNAAGKTHELSVTQVSATSGKLMEVALGGMQLSFTPKLVQ
jgi:hypothetical protein